jgi:hypothetical protein
MRDRRDDARQGCGSFLGVRVTNPIFDRMSF